MALAFDNFGRKFIVLREQEAKSRPEGASTCTGPTSPPAKAFVRILRTSLGPKGMDKVL
jgi:T-complex protein 1 subunit epsilon